MAASLVQAPKEYLSDLRSRTSKKFSLPEDTVHIGHAVIQACLEHPDEIAQIDGGTGATLMVNQMLKKTVQLSQAFINAGLKPGDPILLALPNHADTCIPIYSALVNGHPLLSVDFTFGQQELQFYISLIKPRVVFCIKTKSEIIRNVIVNLGFDTTVIALDDPNNDIETFISKQGVTEVDVDTFTPPLFDLKTPAFFIATSGTTGQPKVAIKTHTNLWDSSPYFFFYLRRFPKSTRLCFLLSPPQWVTATIMYVGSALLAFPRVQTTLPLTPQRCGEIYDKCKPSFMMCSPPKLMELMNSGCCDMSSLEHILIGGSALSAKLETEFKERYPNTVCLPVYGMTELFGISIAMVPNGPLTNVGIEFGDRFTYRLVDPTTGKDIREPNVTGELWVKDSSPFEGYYNNPEETAELFSSDGYIKTGDLLYRDAEGYYFFSERLKTLIKYKSEHVYPTELEEVLRQHPAVLQAAVTGVEDAECGQLPVALVVLKEGCTVTAGELCDLVAGQLSDAKKLRGGIIFVEALPHTPSFKIDRTKVLDIARKGIREY